jgi:hypothetical protein
MASPLVISKRLIAGLSLTNNIVVFSRALVDAARTPKLSTLHRRRNRILTTGLNSGMKMFDDNQEALLTAREHQTILAALRFWRTMVLAPSTPSPGRVLAEVIPVAAAAGTPLSLAEAEALIRCMEALRVGVAPSNIP